MDWSEETFICAETGRQAGVISSGYYHKQSQAIDHHRALRFKCIDEMTQSNHAVLNASTMHCHSATPTKAVNEQKFHPGKGVTQSRL